MSVDRPSSNVNANHATLTESMIHAGLSRFPQSMIAQVNARQWPVIQGILFPLNPFKVEMNSAVPVTEVWFVGTGGVLLGRIVNLLPPGQAVPQVTQDDSLDFIDEETDPQRIQRQRERRVKDALL